MQCCILYSGAVILSYGALYLFWGPMSGVVYGFLGICSVLESVIFVIGAYQNNSKSKNNPSSSPDNRLHPEKLLSPGATVKLIRSEYCDTVKPLKTDIP